MRSSIAFAGVVSVLAACDLVALQHGRVVECADRRPIAGAVVLMRDQVEPRRRTYGETKEDGSYVVAVPGPNGIHQTIAAEGHTQDERDVPNTRDATDAEHEYCLRPAR